MKTKIIFALGPLFLSVSASAIETYTFECNASSLNANGTVSNLQITTNGAVIDGDPLSADYLSAIDNRSIIRSTNRYVNSNQTRVLQVTFLKVDLKMRHHGFAEEDSAPIVSSVFNVDLSVMGGNSLATGYYGTCVERYQSK